MCFVGHQELRDWPVRSFDPEQIFRFNAAQEPLIRERVSLILLLGCLLVPLFGWLDYLLYPALFNRFMAYRLVASLCCLLLYLANKNWNLGYKSSYLGISAFYLVGLIIIKMIADTGGYDTSYYAGLNLVFLGFCSVLPLHPKILTFHCILLYLAYIFSVVLICPSDRISLFLGNNMFVFSTLAIALVASVVNHRLRFSEHLLLEELESTRRKLEAYSKSLESTVEESEEKYRLVVDHANDAIFILQEQGITFPNPKALELFGYSEKELLDLSLSDLVFPEDRAWVMAKCQSMMEQGDSPSMESFRAVNKNGDVLWVDMNSVPIRWMGQKASIHFLRDVTERKKLEIELFQAQKMEAVGTLAGGIAHDFNNLLQVISGYLQIVLMNKSSDHPDYHPLSQIEKSAQRAAELTRQLLLYGRRVESELKPIDLNDLVLRVSSLLERVIPKMIRMEMRLAADLMKISADPMQIEQVIMNLVVNARDAMSEGGRITIETKNFTMDKEFCRKHAGVTPGPYVLLTLSDTGSGMSRDVLERIFDPFYTTKEKGKGTGLGLAIVYSIIKNHRGAVTCQSKPGHGTTFHIYLPAALDERVAPSEPGMGDGTFQGNGETILFVDDDKDLLELTREMLETYNYKAISAETGEEGLEVYQKHMDIIDLVILDLNMPGMGGAKCLEELLRINPGLKVIIATGYLQDGQKEELLKAGASAYVAKPYRFETILREIKVLLQKAGSS